MQIPTPAQAIAKRDASIQKTIDGLTDLIIAKIEEGHAFVDNGKVTLSVGAEDYEDLQRDSPILLHVEPIPTEIERRFKLAGWDVCFGDFRFNPVVIRLTAAEPIIRRARKKKA